MMGVGGGVILERLGTEGLGGSDCGGPVGEDVPVPMFGGERLSCVGSCCDDSLLQVVEMFWWGKLRLAGCDILFFFFVFLYRDDGLFAVGID